MRPDSGYIPITLHHPLRGIKTDVPATQLDPSFSPKIDNMFIRDGVAFKRSGYKELVAQDLDQNVMALINFQLLDGTRKFVAVTEDRQYVYDNSNGEWDDVTATESVHAIQQASALVDYFKISGNHTAMFRLLSEFVVTGSTGNDGTYTVDDDVVRQPSYDSGDDLTTIYVDTGGGESVATNAVDGLITGVSYPVTGANAVADTFDVAGDHEALFTAGTIFRVDDSTGDDGFYTVASSSHAGGTTTITVDEDVDPGTGDGSIRVLREMTSTAGDYIDYAVGTDDDYHRLYITNGRDRPRYWDGSSDSFYLWCPEFTGFETCRTMEVFFDYMVLGYITLASDNPKTIAWSDTSDFQEFNDDNSGILLIPSLSGDIQRIEPLGDRLIVYSDDSIASLTLVGYPTILSSEVLIPKGVRLVSPRGIASFGPAHLFASQENFYFFDGGRAIRPIGDAVRALYKEEINFQHGSSLFAFNDVVKRMIFVFVPTTDDGSGNLSGGTIFTLDYNIYDLRDFKWSHLETTDLPTCFGYYVRETGARWSDYPDVAWVDMEGIWIEEAGQVDFPVRMMGAGSEVFMWDETIGLDDAGDSDTAYTAFYQTPDLVVPEVSQSTLGRWLEFEVDLAGVEVTLAYSTNHGATWTDISTQTLTGEFQTYRFLFDVSSRFVRFKLYSMEQFRFRWGRAWVRVGAPR